MDEETIQLFEDFKFRLIGQRNHATMCMEILSECRDAVNEKRLGTAMDKSIDLQHELENEPERGTTLLENYADRLPGKIRDIVDQAMEKIKSA